MLSFIENKARCLWSCTYVVGTNASKTLELETELKILSKSLEDPSQEIQNALSMKLFKK